VRRHVGHWEDCSQLVSATCGVLGVNNAGMSPLYENLTTITEDYYDKVHSVNLKGPFRLSLSAVGPLVRDRDWPDPLRLRRGPNTSPMSRCMAPSCNPTTGPPPGKCFAWDTRHIGGAVGPCESEPLSPKPWTCPWCTSATRPADGQLVATGSPGARVGLRNAASARIGATAIAAASPNTPVHPTEVSSR
jgi:NAD(P)-dependent dehydrogenase (short-subunit alcohol dehydrogenase family)